MNIIVEKYQEMNGFFTEKCSSTMDMAWHLVEAGRLPPWTWLRAEMQTKGRGQLGREWISDKGNLMVSLRLGDEMEKLGTFLSQAIALCIVRALEPLGISPMIKWPNDIMLAYEKLGGILIEQRKEKIIAGIGLNISSAPDININTNSFVIHVTSLKKYNINIKASELWRLLVQNMQSNLEEMIVNPQKAAKALESLLVFKEDWGLRSRILRNSAL